MKPIFYIFLVVVLLTPFLDNGSFGKRISSLKEISSRLNIDNKKGNANSSMIVLIAGGDVMLGRTVNTRSQKNKDFVWAFKNIAREFSSADISLVNLEAPIIQNCPQTDTGMIFCAPPEHIEGIIAAGIDIAHLANNHIYNQGKEGRDSTISILKQNGISPIGFETAIKEVKGVRFGFIGSNAVEEIDENLLAHQIKDLRQKVAVLIVSFHWGTEYTPLSNQYQKKLAHLSIDSGADVVLGHHPHWVQEKETYQGKPIYYSLGNLIFDQAWSEKTQQGLVVKLYFSGKNFLTSQDLPVKIYDFGQPTFVNSVTLK